MSKIVNYLVLRPHDGDRFYNEGDTRTARDVDVKHLLPNTLEEISETGGSAAPVAAKAETAPLNKAEDASPVNKAVSQRGSKGK